MKRPLIFFLLTLPCAGFSQNKTITVKKNCELCGTWICILPADSIKEAHDGYVKIAFQKEGDFTTSEDDQIDPERGSWTLKKDSLQLIFTDTDDKGRLFHEKESYKITLLESEFILEIPDIGRVMFRRKKQ